MNHGFAVDKDSLPKNVRQTHVSLFDGSNCGIALSDLPVFSVQYHPEASPGPRDSHYLFGALRRDDAAAQGKSSMKKPRVTFRMKRIAEDDWQILAECPGVETQIIKGLKSKAEVDEWLNGQPPPRLAEIAGLREVIAGGVTAPAARFQASMITRLVIFDFDGILAELVPVVARRSFPRASHSRTRRKALDHR